MRRIFGIVLLIVFMLFNVNLVQAEDNLCENDLEGPMITATNIYYEIGTTAPDWLDNVQVTDNCDGVISTENVIVYDISVNLQVEGEYNLGYTVYDSNVNPSSINVKVFVKYDITNPIIDGAVDLTFEVNTPRVEVNFLEGITAIDNKDNDITEDIVVDSSNVDLTTVGTYTLTYTVSDSSENEDVETISVHVVDTIHPVIEGTIDFEFEVHTDLTDYPFFDGVTISDNSGNIKEQYIVLDDINMDKKGEYEITYVAIDESDHMTEVKQKVSVVDTTLPEINGTMDIRLSLNQSYDYLTGISVSDNYTDLGIEDVKIDDSHVNLSQPGTYKLHYFLSDCSGNYTRVTVNVVVSDDDFPVIEGVKDYEFPVLTTEYDFLEGVSANDATDGDLTENIILYQNFVDFSQVGIFKVNYVVFDSSGNMTVETATVTVYDNEQPRIEGVVDITVEVNSESINYLDGVTAFDNLDGNLTNQIIIDSSTVDLTKIGTYQIIYTVYDSNNNSDQKTATITVIDTTVPEIKNNKDITININDANNVNFLEGILATDNYDGDLSGNIVVKGYYNLEKPGVYRLKYEVTDSSGNLGYVYFTLKVINNEQDTEKSYTIYYVISAIGATLIVSGILGYRNRMKR